jgi:hypothetical protein
MEHKKIFETTNQYFSTHPESIPIKHACFFYGLTNTIPPGHLKLLQAGELLVVDERPYILSHLFLSPVVSMDWSCYGRI